MHIHIVTWENMRVEDNESVSSCHRRLKQSEGVNCKEHGHYFKMIHTNTHQYASLVIHIILSSISVSSSDGYYGRA